jgi:hypothetical protein
VRIDSSGHEIGHAPYHVLFDPAEARVDSVTEGDFFRRTGATAMFIPNVSAGRIVIGHSQFGGSQSVTGAGTLAVITFTVLGAGDGSLDLGIERAAPADRGNETLPVSTSGLTHPILGGAP